MEYLRKRHLTNPWRGPFHGRAPSKMLAHAIRGMGPHKSKRGAYALSNLKTFEGIPHPYDKKKRVIIPGAFREIKLKPNRKVAPVGRLASECGWKYQSVIQTLEARRKERSKIFWERKQARAKAAGEAKAAVASKTAALDAQIA